MRQARQLSIFDWHPTMRQEPPVGDYIHKAGAVICRIMRKSYIGKKVAVDISTQNRKCFQVGILEKVIPAHYYQGDQIVETERSIVFVGKKQRLLITHYPGCELHEVLPWNAYEERMASIGSTD